MPTAIDVSSVVGLTAVGALTANILMGLLIASGYNPRRQWPRRSIKIFPFHNWIGYIALALAVLHPSIMLFSDTYRFRIIDPWPLEPPQQPWTNTPGALALYLVAFIVITSHFRRARDSTAASCTTPTTPRRLFYARDPVDPLLQNRPMDWIDAEGGRVMRAGGGGRDRDVIARGGPSAARPATPATAARRTASHTDDD